MSAIPEPQNAPPDQAGPDRALREARRAVEDATRRLEELAAELVDRRAAVDLLESVLDVVLAATTTPIVVADPRRRVFAISRSAGEALDAAVGDRLADVFPDRVARRVGSMVDAGTPAVCDLAELGEGAQARLLPTSHVVLVLPAEGGER